ncbi:MAG: hypothetical protein WC459_03085 [Patescibacteria group bacterium]
MPIIIATFSIALFLIIFFFVKSKGGEDREGYKETKEKWSEIEELMKSNSNLSWKLAIIEADKLMDSALKEAHMRGETMGERLRFSVHKYPKMSKVWEAHIIRNNLVHERDSDINKKEAEKALAIFKEGLKILGVLQK